MQISKQFAGLIIEIGLLKGNIMKNTPLWLKILKWIVGIVIGLVLTVAVACITIYFVYGINVFETVAQVNVLKQQVDETKYDNIFDQSDMQSAKVAVDQKILGLVTYSEAEGYKINTTGLTSPLLGDLYLTDKQCGAILDCIIKQNGGIFVEVAGKKLPVQLLQIKFDNLVEKSVDFNVVVKIDFSPVKQDMTNQPMKTLSKYIPDNLYISATSTITKNSGNFAYTITTKYLEINNLDNNQTASFLKTLNKFTQIGDSVSLNQTVSNPIINALIGNSESEGLAYCMKNVGAKDFDFVIKDGKIYFKVVHIL